MSMRNNDSNAGIRSSTLDNTRYKCMILLEQPLESQLTEQRQHSQNLQGWLARKRASLVNKLEPNLQPSKHIRGSHVAIEHLIKAFLAFSERADFSFTVPVYMRKSFEQWHARHLHPSSRDQPPIYSTAEMLTHGLDTLSPDIWLDLQGSNDLVLRIRDRLSTRLYPTVSLQHALSPHPLIYGRFLRAVLTPSLPCDSLVCTSQASKLALSNILNDVANSFSDQVGGEARFQGRLDVVPLCVNTDLLRPQPKLPLRRALKLAEHSIILLYIGYLSRAKADLAPLLQVVQRLVATNPAKHLLLVIAGTGTAAYSESLDGLVQELGLARNVHNMRDISDVQKQQLLGAADVFVAPCDSMQESFGLTPVEAMACGLPQIVADWSGYRETVVNGETGFLIPTVWGECDGDLKMTGDLLGWSYDHIVQAQTIAFDVASMYNKIQTLIDNPDLRSLMSVKSRARAVAEYSYHAVAVRYDELYTDLLDVSRSLQRRPPSHHFDQPSYYKWFKHFATYSLSDRTVLVQVPPLNKDMLGMHLHSAGVELSLSSIHDEVLIYLLLDLIPAPEERPEGVKVQALLKLILPYTSSREEVLRHLLFLIKHNCVRVLSLNPVQESPTRLA